MSETKLGVGADPATSETVAAATGPSLPSGQHTVRGEQIDRFVVLGTLGQGGMGVVYSAYDPQLDRKVAIKLLTGDAANADAQTRLLREAQAMAKIRHPNVIVVHDVGTYRDQVYVAMEFADGGTLRAWLAAAARTQQDILDVFVQAGRGLAAAHAAGLVHRDFKPDNVLRSRDGRVHVTDFGLVGVSSEQEDRPRRAPTDYEKPVDTGPTPLTTDLTQTGAIMGTPRYMAPEQFQGTAATARTDQFAFCVALYEALYGERPFAGTSFAELCANVVAGTMQPPPKSAHVPAWLRRVLLRGLATDPAARYPAMDALLSALSRSPRRKSVALAVGALAVVGVTGGFAIAAHRSHASPCAGGGDHVRATWSPPRRDAMRAAFAATKRPLAANIFDRSAALIDTWTKQWQDGYVAACEATRVHGEQSEHLLDLRMQCLDRRLGDVGAMITAATTGGEAAVDHALDAFGALPQLAPCADTSALLAAVPPPETPAARAQVAQVRTQLAGARSAVNFGTYAKALELAQGATTAAKATGYAPVIAEASIVTGDVQLMTGDVATAVATLREAMHASARAGDSITMLSAAASLLRALDQQGRSPEAAQEIAGLAESLADHAHPGVDVAVALQIEIAQAEAGRNQLDAAQARLEKTEALAEKELGPDHVETLRTLARLGKVYLDRARFDDARKAFERVLAAQERIAGKDHPIVAQSLGQLAIVYRRQGNLAEAKANLQHAIAISLAALGPEHPQLGDLHNDLGNVLQESGDDEAALAEFLKAKALWEKAYGAGTGSMETALQNIGSEYTHLGRYDDARSYLEQAIALSEKLHGPGNRREVDMLNNLALNAFEQKHYDEALDGFQRSRAMSVAISGPETGDIVDIDMNIANVYLRTGKVDDAIALQRQTIRIAEKAYGPQHPRLGMLLVNLSQNEDAQQHYAESLADLQRAEPIFLAKFGEDHMYTLQVVTEIGQELQSLKRHKEAVPYLERAVAIGDKVGAPAPLMAQIRKELAFSRKQAHIARPPSTSIVRPSK